VAAGRHRLAAEWLGLASLVGSHGHRPRAIFQIVASTPWLAQLTSIVASQPARGSTESQRGAKVAPAIFRRCRTNSAVVVAVEVVLAASLAVKVSVAVIAESQHQSSSQ